MSWPALPPTPGQGAPAVRHPALAACLREAYAPADVARVRRQLEALGLLVLPALPNGLYAANPAPPAGTAYTGYGRTWVRDTVHVASAAWDAGDTRAAGRVAAGLLAFYLTQAPRFARAIAGEARLDDPMDRPHVRFDGEAIAELAEPWPHIQNDAHGYALWFLSRAALAGLLPLDERLTSVLAALAAYFAAIRYDTDRDSGHWEEQRRLSCASVGTVVAGLAALRGLVRAREARTPGLGRRLAGGQDLDGLLARGRAMLAASLPWETWDAAQPARDRRADASLLFLIHPLRVLEGPQADAVLRTVRDELVGPFGVRRYVGDSYWMADYARLFDERTRTGGFFERVDERDRHLAAGTEAQWCLFDPVLSTIWGWRYLATRDPAHRALQVAHFNRALSQVTGPECRFGPGLCPESYYLADSRRPDAWVANDATPLLWTQSALITALGILERGAAAR